MDINDLQCRFGRLEVKDIPNRKPSLVVHAITGREGVWYTSPCGRFFFPGEVLPEVPDGCRVCKRCAVL